MKRSPCPTQSRNPGWRSWISQGARVELNMTCKNVSEIISNDAKLHSAILKDWCLGQSLSERLPLLLYGCRCIKSQLNISWSSG